MRHSVQPNYLLYGHVLRKTASDEAIHIDVVYVVFDRTSVAALDLNSAFFLTVPFNIYIKQIVFTGCRGLLQHCPPLLQCLGGLLTQSMPS